MLNIWKEIMSENTKFASNMSTTFKLEIKKINAKKFRDMKLHKF